MGNWVYHNAPRTDLLGSLEVMSTYEIANHVVELVMSLQGTLTDGKYASTTVTESNAISLSIGGHNAWKDTFKFDFGNRGRGMRGEPIVALANRPSTSKEET